MPNVDLRIPPPLEPPLQSFTTWLNPTDRDVTLDLHIGSSRMNPSGRVRYVVPSKGEKAIPSEFDIGIHHVINGQIVGGLGPQLRRRGGTELLVDSLDVNKSKVSEAAEAAHRALGAKQAAEAALMAAVTKEQEAATAIAAAEAATSAALKPKK